MISKKIQKAFNDQINAELFSAYLYLSMSAYFESINLPGFAGWMRTQSQAEIFHAMKFFHHINDRGGRAKLSAIETPEVEWSSALQAFKDAYAHEEKVTGMINKLVDLALKESDHASNAFLQWFVTEQVEEEMNTDNVVQKLKLAGESTNALLMLDRELGARIFTMPADSGK